MKKMGVVVLVSCIAIAVGGALWWKKTGIENRVVLKALPPPPDLSNVRPVLAKRIAIADEHARTRITASKGLKELSRLYHANGFLEEAMQCYQGLESLEPTEPRWLHLHATILAGFGEIEQATRLWKMVVQLDPNYVPAQLRLGDCLLKSNQSRKPRAYTPTCSRKIRITHTPYWDWPA